MLLGRLLRSLWAVSVLVACTSCEGPRFAREIADASVDAADESTDSGVAEPGTEAVADPGDDGGTAEGDQQSDAGEGSCAHCDASTMSDASTMPDASEDEAGAPCSGDLSCTHLAATCVRGVCDPQQGCVPQVVEGCDCEDGNPCTIDSLDLDTPLREGETACHHALKACDDDGIACTISRCDPSAGCQHVPDDEACEPPSPCQVARCDPEKGCLFEPVEDGTACGWSNCGQAHLCSDGECVLTGTAAPGCNAWFTPGEHGMLPWGVPACGSNTGDGVQPGSHDRRGSYLDHLNNQLLSLPGGRLLYSTGYYESARIFDGERWSEPASLPKVPDEFDPTAWWHVVGGYPDGDLLLAIADEYGGCPSLLRVDLASKAFTSPSARSAESAECPSYVRSYRLTMAPDGSVWAFLGTGLWRFDGDAWSKLDFPDRNIARQGSLIFDDQGLAWVVGGEQHFVWRRSASGFEPVTLPSGASGYEGSKAALTPSGHLLMNTRDSVLEIREHDVIEYPHLPQGERYGLWSVNSDAHGRPIVGGDWGGYTRWRFEDGAWQRLGSAQVVAVDEDFRVYFTSGGRVAELVGERFVPVGEQHSHRSLNEGRTVAPYLLSMSPNPVLDWLSTGAYDEGRYPVTWGTTRLGADDGWETQRTLLEDTAQFRDCGWYSEEPELRRHGDRLVLSCDGERVSMLSDEWQIDLAFPQGAAPQLLIDLFSASVALPEGSIVLAYLVGELGSEGTVHLAYVDEAAQMTHVEPVEGARVASSTWLWGPLVDLAYTEQGLVLLWATMEGEGEAARFVRHGKIFGQSTTIDLGEVPPGKASVDHASQLWINALSASDGPVTPTRWSGTSWEAVAGGPVTAADPNTLAFDRANRPIVAVRSGDFDLGVLTHRDGAWLPIHDSMRPGGVTNSPCSESRAPMLATDGERLCMSWLETVQTAYELLLRCTELPE